VKTIPVRRRWIGAVLGLAAVAVGVVLLVSRGGARRKPEPRGFQSTYYLRQGESAFTERVLARERELEAREGGPPDTETGLGTVTCVPQPPAPLPSLTIACTAIVDRRVLDSHARPYAQHTWRATVRLNARTEALTVVSLRRTRGSSTANHKRTSASR